MNLWPLNEEMGYDAKVKERVDVNKVRSLCKNPGAVNNLKNFIELPNADADIVVSKRIIKVMKNEADEEEKDIIVKVVKDEKEKEKADVGKIVDVDDSIEAVVEADETEAESIEDGGILVSDGDEGTIRE
jgi:glycyl-tRNA synthetase beta subunit